MLPVPEWVDVGISPPHFQNLFGVGLCCMIKLYQSAIHNAPVRSDLRMYGGKPFV